MYKMRVRSRGQSNVNLIYANTVHNGINFKCIQQKKNNAAFTFKCNQRATTRVYKSSANHIIFP